MLHGVMRAERGSQTFASQLKKKVKSETDKVSVYMWTSLISEEATKNFESSPIRELT